MNRQEYLRWLIDNSTTKPLPGQSVAEVWAEWKAELEANTYAVSNQVADRHLR